MFILFIFIYTTREMNHDEPTSPSIERGSENPRDPWRKDGQAPHAWSPRTSTTAHAMDTTMETYGIYKHMVIKHRYGLPSGYLT